jgi:hypothetical protein
MSLTIGGGAGHFEWELAVGTWGPIWDSIYAYQYMDASLRQVPDPPGSQYEQSSVQLHIFQTYRCTNLVDGSTEDVVIDSMPGAGGESRCEYANETRGKVIGVTGGFVTYFYKSTPLGQCLSGAVTLNSGGFTPSADMTEKIKYDGITGNCLCATGGTGDYEFSIDAGNLPSGITLDPDTGCFEGEADGAIPGTFEITYRVVDKGGAGAPPPDPLGETSSGACNTFGSGVTRIAGKPFTPEMVGLDFVIHPIDPAPPISVQIASVADEYHLTLVNTSAGINDHIWWTVTFPPVTTVDPPKEPETATVTCGYLPGPCVTSTPSGNYHL